MNEEQWRTTKAWKSSQLDKTSKKYNQWTTLAISAMIEGHNGHWGGPQCVKKGKNNDVTKLYIIRNNQKSNWISSSCVYFWLKSRVCKRSWLEIKAINNSVFLNW